MSKLPRQIIKLPNNYRSGFLTTIARSSELGRRLNANFAALIEDVGGVERTNRAQLMLIERLVFVNEVASQVEQSIVQDPLKQVNLLGKYASSINTLIGLVRALRLDNPPEQSELDQLYLDPISDPPSDGSEE